MKKIRFIAISAFLLCILSIRGRCQGREEFNGPYNSWADIKKRFGAKGNGKDDDTRACQQAVDGLAVISPAVNGKPPPAYTVIYIPAGTYCISSTLVLSG